MPAKKPRLKKGDLKPGQRRRLDKGIEARGVVPSPENKNGIVYGIRYEHQGREIRKDVGQTITAARAALAAVKADISRGEYRFRTRKNNPTFLDFVPTFITHVETNKSSSALDKQLVKPLSEFFKKRRLGGIERRDFEDYKTKRISEVRPRTVNLELWCAQQLFDVAIMRGCAVLQNPVRGVKRLKVKKRKYHILSDDEEARLANAAAPWLRDFILLAVDTGLRLGEATALKPADFDSDDGTINVYQSKTNEFKVVPLTERAMDIITRGIALSCPTVLTRDGKPLNDIHPAWYRLLKKTGLKGVRIHDLRHTFATRLARDGTDIRTLMDLTGHEDVEIALDYIESSPAAKRAAIERLSKRTRTLPGPDKENGPREVS